MQVNSVRYENPTDQTPAWQTALAGIIQGGAGQIGLQQAQAQKEKDANRAAMQQLLVAMAQQNRTNLAAPGTPGAIPFAGQNWSIAPAPVDWGAQKNKAETEKLNWEMQNPDQAMYKAAGTQMLKDVGFASALNPTGDPNEAILNAMAQIQAMKTGVGMPVPGKTGSKGLFGLGLIGATPDTPTSRARLTKGGVVKEYLNPDGSWSSKPGASNKTLKKPSFVAQADWDKASDQQKEEFLGKING